MENFEHGRSSTYDGKVVLETQKSPPSTSCPYMDPSVNPQQLFGSAPVNDERWWHWLCCSCLRGLTREDTQPLLEMSSSDISSDAISSDEEMIEWDARSIHSMSLASTTPVSGPSIHTNGTNISVNTVSLGEVEDLLAVP